MLYASEGDEKYKFSILHHCGKVSASKMTVTCEKHERKRRVVGERKRMEQN